jgi:hypothetical protein
MTIWQPKG